MALSFVCFFPGDSRELSSKHAQTQALRNQTRSGSGTQKKLKIFERQLSKAAAEACSHWPALAISHCFGRKTLTTICTAKVLRDIDVATEIDPLLDMLK